MNSRYSTDQITPEIALQLLTEGNSRFISGLSRNRDLAQEVDATKNGQTPFAAILGCMDSRAPAEFIFDQGIGDLFNIRIAGNVVSPFVIGSLEYAIAAAGAKLVLVMGHTGCGAVKGACDHVEMGHLTGLLEQIQDSVNKEKSTLENRTGGNADFVNEVARINVHHSVSELLRQSDIIRSYVEQGKILLVPAMYNISTGEVSFMHVPAPVA